MKGTMLVIHSGDETVLIRQLKQRPDLATIRENVGGVPEKIPAFDLIMVGGEPAVACVAFRNSIPKDLPRNILATQAWMVALGDKEMALAYTSLHGDVVVLYGDDEFMAAI